MSSSLSVSNTVFLFLTKEKNTLKKKKQPKGKFPWGYMFSVEKNWLPFLSNPTITKWNPSHTQNKVLGLFKVSVVELIWAVPHCKPKMTVLGTGGDTHINIRTLILFLSISGAIMLSTSTQKCCVNMSLQQKCSWCPDNRGHVLGTPACYLSWPNTEDKQCHGSGHML